MRYASKYAANLKEILKALQGVISDGTVFTSRTRKKEFGGMMPRELLGNLLVCVVANAENNEPGRFTIAIEERAPGADGIIFDTKTGGGPLAEHTLARGDGDAQNDERAILEAIKKKQDKGGEPYASGKQLVVLVTTSGEWSPKSVTMNLPDPLDFDSVLVIRPERAEDNEYAYSVTVLDEVRVDALPVWRVRIHEDFESWEVERV
jgi:hypothetical protein